jgi:aryl-alcohol dehydrogenase-like predicted oxidoreductase
VEESIAALVTLKDEGKIRHIGVSNMNEEQLRQAQQITPIVSLQNRYNPRDRNSESLIDLCETEDIVFLPWGPIQDLEGSGALQEIAAQHGATPQQIALAWLLARSPMMLPIPGTGSVSHLEENVASSALRLTPQEIARLSEGG